MRADKRNISEIEVSGSLQSPTFNWKPFGPVDFVFPALRALKPSDTGGVGEFDRAVLVGLKYAYYEIGIYDSATPPAQL